MNKFIYKHLSDSILFIFILIISFKLAHDAWKYTDIIFYDESMYLSKGVKFIPFSEFFKDGYIYFAWYKFLSLFAVDNIDLYFLNNSILLFAPSIAIYIFLRVIKTNLLIAFFTSVLFLISAANMITWPFITKFTLLVMLIGLIIVYCINDRNKKLSGAFFLSAVITYIRPEFILTMLILLVIYCIILLKETACKINRRLIVSLLPVLPVLILILIYNPVKSDRASLAFMQHYSKDINERRGVYTVDGLKDADSIMMADFGGNVSLKNAFLKNPFKFLEHTKYNLLRLPRFISYMVPYTVTEGNESVFKIFIVLSYICLAVSILFFIKCILKKELSLFRFIFLSFALPTLISIIVYYPRDHYLLLTIVFVIIFFSFELSKILKKFLFFKKYSPMTAIALGVVMVAFMPVRSNDVCIHDNGCTTFNTLKTMRDFQLSEQINLLAAGSGIQNYLGSNWNYISAELIDGSLEEFIEKNNVNIILVDNYLFTHPKIKADTAFRKLIEDKKFIKYGIPNCTSYLLVKILLSIHN